MGNKSKLLGSKIFYSKIFYFCLALFIIWLILIVVRTAWEKYQLVKEIRITEEQLKYLDQNSEKLKKSIKLLQSEKFLQKEAKERLNLKNPSEKVIIFKKPSVNK